MTEKNFEEMEQKTDEIVCEDKPKFGTKVKMFFARNKNKIIIGGLAATGIVAGALVKSHKDKVRAAEAEDEAERAEMAEDWFNRGIEAGRASVPETIEIEVTDNSTEESV